MKQSMLKTAVKKILGVDKIKLARNIYLIATNYYKDLCLYYRHSTVFKSNELSKIECQLILDYHGVEKGFLFQNTRPRFAQQRIENLHRYLNLELIRENIQRSQIKVAYQVMCQYYELHKNIGIDISDYYTEQQYNYYKDILATSYNSEFKGAIECYSSSFYDSISSDFSGFSNSRKSIREYTGESVPIALIEQAITLALNTPSVCNRQASKVYFLNDKNKVLDVLKIQGGLAGYTDNVTQLLILTVDRNYFYTIGERNQLYIDGGMFLMNLLYALHFHKIANCPIHWGKTVQEEKALEGVLTIPESEKIICMIPIGIAKEKFKVTLSQRRDLVEVLRII